MTRKSVPIALLAVAVAFLYAPAATAQPSGCTVSLQASTPSPQRVGERIVWTATAANCGPTPVYQFSVAGRSQAKQREESEHERARHRFTIVRDYSLDGSFAWAPCRKARTTSGSGSRTDSMVRR
jgi:hypothetical protein